MTQCAAMTSLHTSINTDAKDSKSTAYIFKTLHTLHLHDQAIKQLSPSYYTRTLTTISHQSNVKPILTSCQGRTLRVKDWHDWQANGNQCEAKGGQCHARLPHANQNTYMFLPERKHTLCKEIVAHRTAKLTDSWLGKLQCSNTQVMW